MQDERMQYRGRYDYPDRATLERALAKARDELDGFALAESGGWLRFFVTRGTSLTVNVTVPASTQHRVSTEQMFATLAAGAIDGCVEALDGALALDRLAVAAR
jgi:hypothetical protein